MPQLVETGAGAPADVHHWDVGQRGFAEPFARLFGGGPGIGQIAAGNGEQAVPHSEGGQGVQVLGGLRHPAFIGGDHEQHCGDRADPGQHVGHEALVTRHIDEGRGAAVG